MLATATTLGKKNNAINSINFSTYTWMRIPIRTYGVSNTKGAGARTGIRMNAHRLHYCTARSLILFTRLAEQRVNYLYARVVRQTLERFRCVLRTHAHITRMYMYIYTIPYLREKKALVSRCTGVDREKPGFYE